MIRGGAAKLPPFFVIDKDMFKIEYVMYLLVMRFGKVLINYAFQNASFNFKTKYSLLQVVLY